MAVRWALAGPLLASGVFVVPLAGRVASSWGVDLTRPRIALLDDSAPAGLGERISEALTSTPTLLWGVLLAVLVVANWARPGNWPRIALVATCPVALVSVLSALVDLGSRW
ncbi:hypothetical protein LX83_004468 [Goodfellowiella coeruleoviolacea]|uniref:Uncharacterized protein n=2 Tax=Goodfellowiella coeruleoviolacea TaxID=334858 RepID=A0AAE3GHQ1_9PSEU|nr:hypothetical protein [Goodfellowiella coeruleoviolacea]